MTGRGQTGRGGARPEFVLDSYNRRSRSRPRRYPPTGSPQMPSSGDDHPVEDGEFRGADEGEYFDEDQQVVEGEEVVQEEEVEEEQVVEEDGVKEMNEREIQQQKMKTVTPMAQKRIRGRPRRQSTASQPTNEDDNEIIESNEMPESDAAGPSEESRSTRSRARHITKRLNDIQAKKASHGKESVTIPPLPLAPNVVNKISDDNEMEQLIPEDEQHIEAMPDRVIEEEIEEEEVPASTLASVPRNIRYVEEQREEEEAGGPPPAPRHLVNKANSRGRPANPIPPHRRPIPKDLVPPGAMILKRSNQMRGDPLPAKRKDLREKVHIVDDEGPPPLHPPRAPTVTLDDTPPSPLPLSEVPIAVQQVEIKHEVAEDGDVPPPMPAHLQQVASPEAAIKKDKREGGKDLPSEHFPKEKARHVSTRGIHPFSAEKTPMLAFEMIDDIGHEPDEPVAQQRVLTLQGSSFIDDRIGRADMMEDEEMKMIKGLQHPQYIMEENGVMYEMPIGGEEQVEMDGTPGVQEDQYVIEGHQMQRMEDHSAKVEMNNDSDDDDELPPQLIPEGVPSNTVDNHDDDPAKESALPIDEDGNFDFHMMHEGQTIRLQSPGGRDHEVRVARDEQGNSVFIDENGQIVELVTDNGTLVDTSCMQEHQVDEQGEPVNGKNKPGDVAGPSERANLDYMNTCSFLDNNNICCGLCGEIVAYEKLVTEHLPNAHPEYLSPGVELEEVPYNSWLKTRLKQESKMMENGFRHYDEHDGAGFGGAVRLYSKGLRQMRKVSQIRVNVNEMTMPQLELALKRKLIEKMGRKVPVSLVDRLHARCDICQAVVSLNKKFEVIHLVRHFNAWHPAEHRCTQEWKESGTVSTSNARRPLSLHDFAVVSTETDQNNLQCIWCGMMMDRAALGMHFSEVHAQQVVVPNCSLCLQEMVMTARLMEKYGEDFGISLPDEFHLLSSKLNAKYSSEKAMDKAIDKYLKRANKGMENEEDLEGDDQEAICTTNSQQSFGRRNRLKRKFVKPCFRQICPVNSEFFEAKSACEWKCRLCNRAVYGAVISAGAIKHYKEFHPADIDRMQYELVKARLERIGDGSMEFVHPQLVECLICSLTYALHKPFNICRAIRHLRLKHPEVMPETAGKPISGAEISETTTITTKSIGPKKPPIRFAEVITDPIELEKFRKENFDQQFDKVQVVYGIKKNNEPAYILLMEHETMDHRTAMEMAEKMRAEQETIEESRFDQLVPREEEVVEEEVIQMEQYEEPSSSQIYEEEDTKPLVMAYPEGEEEIVEEMEPTDEDGTEFIQTYDANNPDHVLIEENDLMTEGNYEMIQEGEEYPELEDNRTVRYLTEDEIREAQARGEILEFEEEEYVDAEYADQQ